MKLQDLLDAAERHGKDSDPDHEVGDLQDILWTCFNTMTAEQQAQILDVHSSLVDDWPKP